jgi:hypothetical protein
MPCLPERGLLDRCPFYCEENVWRLLGRPEFEGLSAWAVIASNRNRRVLAEGQLAGRGRERRVLWDYHVFALVDDGNGLLALDLDSDLGFPLPARLYVEGSFPAAAPPDFAPFFRLVGREEWLRELSSDRSHMRVPDGTWTAPPPSWDPPDAGGRGGSNLMAWVGLEAPEPGILVDRAGLLSFIESRGKAR